MTEPDAPASDGSSAGWGVAVGPAPQVAWGAAAAGAASAIAFAARDEAKPFSADGLTPLQRAGAADELDAKGGDAGARAFAVPETTRYADGGLLGRGGMGVVTATLDRRLGRVVARKQVASAALVDPSARARLAREAAITARLDHPGIVPVYDAGIGPDGEPFYTMRLVVGRTLADAIAEQTDLQGRFGLLRRTLAAVEAVAYAHDKGVVHRDLKPANILLGSFGEAQVVDWGLARQLEAFGAVEAGAVDTAATEAEPAIPATQPDPAMTRLGAIVGTPGYLAPEVAAGAPHSKRSDVYGLGVALREIVAASETPAELQAILDCATAKNPAERYRDAGALAVDLEALLDGRRVAAHRYSPWEHVRRLARLWRTPLWIAGVALASVAAVLVGALVWTSAERDAALDAERRAVDAHAIANRSLGRALRGAAQVAAAQLQLPEAEVLAAHALALADDPLARGVLMRARVQAPVLLAPPLPLPLDCLRTSPNGDGSLLGCARDGVLELWELDPPRLRWKRAISAQSLTLTARHALVSEGIAELTRLDLATGDRVVPSPPPIAGLSGGWQATERGDHALRFDVSQALVVDASTGQTATLPSCDGRTTVAAARCTFEGPSVGAIATVCEDGLVTVVDAAGLPMAATRTALDSSHRSVGVAWWSHDCRRLYLGSHDGTIAGLQLPDGAPLFQMAAGVGQIEAFAGDDRWLVVAGERGGVELRDQRSGVLLGRLPARAGRQMRMRDDGELRTFGAAMWRWRLPIRPVALALPGGDRAHGLASAAIAPDGECVAIARADGTILVAPLDGRPAFVAERAFSTIAKFVAWTVDGAALVASGVPEPGLLRYAFDGDVPRAVATPLSAQTNGLRRVVALASGALLTIDYGGTMVVLPGPGAPPQPSIPAGRPSDPRPAWLDLSTDAPGRRAVAVDSAGTIELCRDGVPVRCSPLALVAGSEVAALPLREGAVYVAGPGQVRQLDGAGKVVARASTDGVRVHDLAVSPDDALLAVAQLDGRVRVLDRATLRLRAMLQGHELRVSAVSFDAAGSRLISASWDGSVLLWDVATLALPAATLVQQASARWGLALDDVLHGVGDPVAPSQEP